MANHNRLLGRVKGVDGIKTGYTRASGFNLVSSVSDGKRRIVAVVMGGQTGRARDNHMAELIKKYLPKASGRDGGDLVAKAAHRATVEVAVGANRRRRTQPKPRSRAARRPSPRLRREPIAEGDTVEEAVVQAYRRTGHAEAEGARRRRSGQHVVDRSAPSGWAIQVASTPKRSGQVDARQDRQAGAVDPCRRSRLHGAVRQGRRHLLPRPFRRLLVEIAAWNACSALKKKKIACYAVLQ